MALAPEPAPEQRTVATPPDDPDPDTEAEPMPGAEGFLGDMEPAEFRAVAHATVDQIADYLERLPSLPPLSRVQPGELASALPEDAPVQGEPMDQILRDVDSLLLPGITHWAHPRFFAYFTSSGSAAGILGEMLTAGINANAMLWRTSPAATELEFVVCRWLARMMGLPDSFDGHINDTASASTLVALAAAREGLGRDIRQRGLAGRSDLAQILVYASEQAHSSVEKAVITLGLGRDGFRPVPVDSDFRMDVPSLRRLVSEDLARGALPMAVVATVGTTATTSIDPVPEIAELCKEFDLWLHIDAAHGGAMAVVPEWRGVLAGADLAESLVVNPHKWLFTQLDCSVLYTSRPEVLKQAFSVVPEYLATPEAGRESGLGSRNLMDYGVSLGRRMRALKLWFVLRHYGQEGLAQRIRQHVQMAHWLRGRIRITPGWELSAPVPMATVCFRHHPPGVVSEARLAEHNREIMARVNQGGEAFISHAVLGDQLVLRAAVGNIRTQPQDVAALWDALQQAAAA
ncbi:MAG TPA: pyridoxal-dependent decarboxylase [Candidatus Dormibacteraeota bacterium]|nr:pyridoxal-dependent decarboxylase [Candidatus Dormibacteraeota bacterium]